MLPAPVVSAASEATAFWREVDSQIHAFPTARLVRRVDAGNVAMAHYHAILTTLFHQTQSGPYTFAKAAVNCGWQQPTAKEYLLRHAEEERTHWRWVLDDLRNTGYVGACPTTTLPHPSCEAFISYQSRIAELMPVGRLAMAAVLEGIGAAFGSTRGRQLLVVLGIAPKQASFFLSHGETDKVHTQELRDVIESCELSPPEWGWMTHSARIAGQFYRAMYDHEAFA